MGEQEYPGAQAPALPCWQPGEPALLKGFVSVNPRVLLLGCDGVAGFLEEVIKAESGCKQARQNVYALL